MERGKTGTYECQSITGESYQAFVPFALPPEVPLVIDERLADLLEKANRAVGRLDGLAQILPDVSLFLYFYIRKEAVLSSQIEGTQSSLSDLLLFESDEVPGVPMADVQEVSRYVAAMQYGLDRIRTDGFPLSSRLLREMHGVLLSQGRGSTKEPGEFRRSQNWIGGSRPGNARFVPPPHEKVPECIGALENFLHDVPTRTPTLIKAALAHVQFETIHPFLDGNGRIGRLLITLLLCAEGAVREPLLYLSLYFKENRTTYYELLSLVRERGDWEEWLAFFLTGVCEVGNQASQTARSILTQFDTDQKQILTLKRQTASTLRVHTYLQKHPLTEIAKISQTLDIAYNTALQSVEALQSLGIVSEVTGRQRDRVFSYSTYLALLNEGTTTAR